MKNLKVIWNEYMKSPVVIVTVAYLAGFGFFLGACAAANFAGVSLVIGYAP